MQIIALKKTGKDVHIVFESGEELVLRYELYVKNGLRKGDNLDDDKIDLINRENKIFLAKERAFNILSKRNNSTGEIKRKLIQRKFDKDTAESVVNELAASGFLNDEQFAKEYVEEKLKLNAVGLNKICSELYSKGINKGIIESVLSEKSDADEYENAIKLAAKKMKSSVIKNVEAKKQKQKLYSFLLSKGFDYSTIDMVIKKIFTGEEE
jgi:regulatory protein